jgi:aminoglycoside phosphotransferase family enzyme/predicted kinase
MSAIAYAGPREPVDEPAARLEFLRTAAAWPGEPSVPQLIETHISWVFLGERYAYKLKKPVAFGFVDFSTRELRHAACEQEVRLNRRLAPQVYLGLAPITFDARGQRRIGGDGPVDDWLVRMRRLPADRALDRLLVAGTLAERDIEALTNLLAGFYASLPPLPIKAAEYRDSIARHVQDNREDLRRATHRLPADLVERTQAAQLRLLGLYPEWFEHRVCDGRIVEGHGDLRPEHIYFAPRPVVIDALEFSGELRTIDVADELSFLAAECACLFGSDAGYRVRDRYCALAHDQPPPGLLAFYEAYRASVRAKVAALRASQQTAADAEASWQLAERYLRWCDQRLAAVVPPSVIAVCGLSGTGKSHIAKQLAEQLAADWLSTDAIRRLLRDTPAAEPAVAGHAAAGFATGRYSAERRGEVYAEIARRLPAALRQRGWAIVDGTWGKREQRADLAAAAAANGAAVLFIHCHCPIDVASKRVHERAQRPGCDSEMRAELLPRQAAEEEPFRSDEPVVELDTSDAPGWVLRAALDILREKYGGVNRPLSSGVYKGGSK